MANDAPFMVKHQRAIMLVLVLMVIPTFGIAGPEIYAYIERLANPLKNAAGTFELEPGETIGVTEEEFLETRQTLWTVSSLLFRGDAPSPETVWNHIIKVRKAKHLGIAVSDQDLAAVLRRYGFAADPEGYKRLILQRGLTVSLFEKFVREMILAEMLDALEASPPLHSSDRIYERFKNEKQRYKIDFTTFAAADYVEPVGADAWSEDNLKTMWEDGANFAVKEKLRVPARFSLDVAYAPFDTYPLDELGSLAEGIEANESEMLNRYANPDAQERYREAATDATPAGEKPPLKPFADVKETISREIRIQKILEKAFAEAMDAKTALDEAKAAREKRAAEEKAAGSEGEGAGAKDDGATDEGDKPADQETPKDKNPPEPLQDGAPAPEGGDAKPAEPEADAAVDERLDLGPIIEKYKLSRVALSGQDEAALKTAKLSDTLTAAIPVAGLLDGSIVRLFSGPGPVAGFGVVTGHEPDRLPEFSAVVEEFRAGMKEKKSFELAHEAAQAFLKDVKSATETRNEAKKPASVRERERLQKEAEEAAKKKREEEEAKAKEAADAEKAKETAPGTPEDGEKKADGGDAPPDDKTPPPPAEDKAPPGGDGASMPPPAPPQGGEDPAPPAPAAAESVTELSETEWAELMQSDTGVSFDALAQERGLPVVSTDWITFAAKTSPELAKETDPALKFLRTVPGIKNYRPGQVGIHRDNEAKATYVVRMKEKQDPAWEEMSAERSREILGELYDSSIRNRQRMMAQMGFESLAREVKLATLHRSPSAMTGLPPRR